MEDEAEAHEKLKSAIMSVQDTIDALMGDSQSVQSKDYMTGRYNDLLANAQADPAKAQEFASFATQYLDFMSDYGDPKARETVLQDLQGIQSTYLEAKAEIEESYVDSSGDIFDISYVNTIAAKQLEYFTARSALQNSWYEKEKEFLEESIVSIDELWKTYSDAFFAVNRETPSTAPENPNALYIPPVVKPDYEPASMPSYEEFISGFDDKISKILKGLMSDNHWGGIRGDEGNIDKGVYSYWQGLDTNNEGSAWYESIFEAIKDHYGVDRLPFADGGVLSGPLSGYDVNAQFHGTEAIIPINSGYVPVKIQGGNNNSKRVEELLTKLVSLTNKSDGKTEIRVYVGNKELKSFTAETIRTDPETQRSIKRVVNV